MRKIIAFSVFGDNPMYYQGVLRNIELLPAFYPDWECFVYYDNTTPESFRKELLSTGVTTRDMTDSGIYGLFWRFLANDENQDGYTIFRDADSRISKREKLAVEEWIQSGKSLHVMRDHPAHRIPYGVAEMAILAGMWGIKAGLMKFEDSIRQFHKNGTMVYGSDQAFLLHIYKHFNKDMFVHDEFNGGNPFPIKRINYHFVGERFDANDQRYPDYLALQR